MTVTFREHRREDLTTKLLGTEYQPDAPCPQWLAFLDRVLAGNQSLISFLQRAVGYSLTGETSEQCLFLLYGTGANGKSTFLETLLAMFGSYGSMAQFDTFLEHKGDRATNDLAALVGVRFVCAVEPDAGKRLSESIVKQITGGDTITARFLHKEFFSYRPQFKVWLAANHKPQVRGTDEGIWRRIRLVPFTVTIPEPERDKQLTHRLRAELPGILAWAVRGCEAWQREGLGMPDAVRQATEAYRTEMDVVGAFLADCCVQQPQAYVASGALYAEYTKWCERTGERALTQRALAFELAERGFTSGLAGGKTQRTRVWRGLGLLADGLAPVVEGDRKTEVIANFAENQGSRAVTLRDHDNHEKHDHLRSPLSCDHPWPEEDEFDFEEGES